MLLSAQNERALDGHLSLYSAVVRFAEFKLCEVWDEPSEYGIFRSSQAEHLWCRAL